MKGKVVQFIIIGFIVLMLTGILMSVKDTSSGDTTNIVSGFEDQSGYYASGYTSTDPFNEDNVNDFGRVNGMIGNAVSTGVNKGIDLIFEFLKKIVS